MGNFTEVENRVLLGLVSDCITYGFTENEALSYIKSRFGREISPKAYYRRKKRVDSGNYVGEWLNHYTRFGFVKSHKRIIETVEKTIQKNERDCLIEESKPYVERDMELIIKLRSEIMRGCMNLQEVSLGTPIIAQIKAKLEQHQHQQEDAQVLQPSQ